jgi:hypothetical protein
MKLLRFFLPALLALMVSCGTTTPTPVDPDVITEDQIDNALTVVDLNAEDATVNPNTQIKANVLPFGKNRMEAIVSVDRSTGTVILDKSLLTPTELEKIIPDTIVVGYNDKRAKRGFIRKIASVTDLGTQLAVTTLPGKLKDVFSNGGFRVHRKTTVNAASKLVLTDGQVLPLQVRGSSGNTRGLVNLPVEKTFCPVNVDGNKNTKNDQICVTGTFDFDLGFDFSFDCSGILCTNPYLDTHVTFTETAKLTIEGELTRTVEKDYLLGKAVLGSFTIPVLGIPLVFVAEVELRVNLFGQVSAKLRYVANQKLEITAGIELKDGNFKPYTKFDNDITSSDVEVSIDASAKATLSGELSVLLYGITGPTLTAEAWAKLEYGSSRSPSWELTAGLDWFLGVKLDLFGLVDLSWDTKLTGLKWDIAEAKNTKPIITVNEPVDEEEMTLPNELAGSIFQAYNVDFRVKSDDKQDGVNCCRLEWFIDDLYKGQTLAGSGHDPTWLVTNSGRHNVKIISYDSDGATTTKRFNFVVNDCKNTVTLVATGKKSCILQAPFNPLPYPYPVPTTW